MKGKLCVKIKTEEAGNINFQVLVVPFWQAQRASVKLALKIKMTPQTPKAHLILLMV